MVVADKKLPVSVPVKSTEAVLVNSRGALSSTSSTVIVFEISAMDQPTIEKVKSALEQKAGQMIQTVEVPCEELEELSKESEDKLMSLQCADVLVTVEIGKPALLLVLLLYFSVLRKRPPCCPMQ